MNSLPHSLTGNIKSCIISKSFYVLLISIPAGSLTYCRVCHYWWNRVFYFLLKWFCFSSMVSIATHTGSDESLSLLQLSTAVSCQDQQLTWHCEAAGGHEATLALLSNGRCLSTRGRSLLVHGMADFWSHLPLFWTQRWESYPGRSFAWNVF